MADDLTPAQQDTQSALHDFLQRHAALIGPEFDGDEEGEAVSAPIIEEWVIVAAWLDMDSGERFTTRIGSVNLPAHHRTGLLHQALFQFDD